MGQVKISFIKKWWISIRPFSLPASTVPVVFGTALAVAYGKHALDIGNFLLAFIGMIVLHGGANILSDIFDFQKGLDQAPAPTSGGVIRGYISIREAWTASVLMLIFGAVIGLYLSCVSGPWLLGIGLLGLFVGTFYTSHHKLSFKYNGFGDLAVFLNFGILGSLGAYYVQAHQLSLIPVIWAVPMSLLVIAILHANNWRDIQSDKSGKIITIAGLLGDRNSLRYYGFLIYGPFALVLLFILIPHIFALRLAPMPYTFVITLLALPLSLKLWRKAVNRSSPAQPLDFIALDGATAQLNLLFGSLSIVALLLHAVLQRIGTLA